VQGVRPRVAAAAERPAILPAILGQSVPATGIGEKTSGTVA
jgi:hypothetical protein